MFSFAKMHRQWIQSDRNTSASKQVETTSFETSAHRAGNKKHCFHHGFVLIPSVEKLHESLITVGLIGSELGEL